MNGWINVKDRLPEDGQEIYVVSIGPTVLDVLDYKVEFLEDGSWAFVNHDCEYMLNATVFDAFPGTNCWWRPKGQSETVAESVDGSAAARLAEIADELESYAKDLNTPYVAAFLYNTADEIRKVGGKS